VDGAPLIERLFVEPEKAQMVKKELRAISAGNTA